jgi:hypothetical protein
MELDRVMGGKVKRKPGRWIRSLHAVNPCLANARRVELRKPRGVAKARCSRRV